MSWLESVFASCGYVVLCASALILVGVIMLHQLFLSAENNNSFSVSKTSVLGVTAAILSASVFSLPALAQESAETVQLKTIQVGSDKQGRASAKLSQSYVADQADIATKTANAPLKTPRNIATVGTKEINDRNALTVSEALQYNAGVSTYFRPGNLTREYTSVRGFEVFQYRDGLKLHDSNWGVEPFGLERVDVLKGPASMLYGLGSPGGLINLTSKRPTGETHREIMLQAGNNKHLEAGIDFAGSFDENQIWQYRFVGLGRSADGHIDYTSNDRLYLAPSLTWQPDAATSLTVLGNYQRDPKLSVLQPLPYKGTVVEGPDGRFISRKTFLGEPDYHDSSKTAYRIGYEFKHEFNDNIGVEQNLGYSRTKIDVSELQSMGMMVSPTEIRRQMFDAEYEIETFQVDTRVKAQFDTGPVAHQILAGVDYAWIPNYQAAGVNRSAPFTLDIYNPVYGQALPDNPLTSKRDQDQRQLGFYLQDQITIGNLTAVAGIRRDHVDFKQKNRVPDLVNGGFTNPDWAKKSDHATTAQLGAIYAFDNGFAPYFNFSQSFSPVTGSDAAGNLFEPITGTQYEAGIKYAPTGLDLMASAALFQVKQKNVLTRDLDNPGYAIQTGETRSRGVELEMKTTLPQGINLSAGYTYLDVEVTKTNTVGGVGKAPVGMPKHQASLWGTYTFDENIALAGLTLGTGLRYVGRSQGDAMNTFSVPSFTLVDALVRYNFGGIHKDYSNLDFALNAKNIANKRFVSSCDDASNCYYGEGRSITATLRAKF